MQSQTISQIPKIATQPETDCYNVTVPTIDGKLHCGTRFYVPEHEVIIAKRYPILAENFRETQAGTLIAGEIGGQQVTQAWVADFLRQYNKANGTKYRLTPEFEDFHVRRILGARHAAFDQNFGRAQPLAWGYLADRTEPQGSEEIEGLTVNGRKQGLVPRRAFIYDASGEPQEIGITTFAPDGEVPWLTKAQYDELIESRVLAQDFYRNLGKLRGREICEAPEEIVDVRNALGYAQLTFLHDYKIEGRPAPHSHHQYRPEIGQSEAVAVRDADWRPPHDGRCFGVCLRVRAGDSHSGRSFPLIRGEEAEVTVTPPAPVQSKFMI